MDEGVTGLKSTLTSPTKLLHPCRSCIPPEGDIFLYFPARQFSSSLQQFGCVCMCFQMSQGSKYIWAGIWDCIYGIVSMEWHMRRGLLGLGCPEPCVTRGGCVHGGGSGCARECADGQSWDRMGMGQKSNLHAWTFFPTASCSHS